MDHTRRKLLIAAAGTSLLAGCIGDDDDDTDDDGMDPGDDDGNGNDMDEGDNGDDGEEEPAKATVQLGGTDDFGDVLVGPDDLTLYMFDPDEQGESTCYDDCADNWPPLIDDDPVAGDGVDAALTTFEREDGEVQVASNGWPLYYWVADEEPGDVDGQGVNDVWWVLDASGEPIRDEDTGQPGNGEEEEDDDGPSPGY